MTRGLVVLALAPIAASLVFGFASCDSGGEPPETFDGSSGFDAILFSDVAAVDVTTLGDTGTPETSSADEPDLEDVVVDAGPCGVPGSPCCAGSTCVTAGYACNSIGKCSLCGGAGEACCDLNTCNDGGCCLGNTCAGETSICTGTDGAVCANNACGECGGLGQPCCGTSGTVCTAPQALCMGDAGGSSCQECGGLGELCCGGQSCAGSSLACDGESCVTSP